MATKKQSRPKVKGVVNPKGITQVFGTPIDFKALPEKISINRRLSNGKFKLEAHYPAKHFNDKQNYIGKRKEGSYCRFYDNKSPFFIARTVWDAASQPGMHMMVKNRGETHRFIVTPKVDDPTKASVIGSYLVHRDNGDPVLCSGVIGELEAVGDDGDFKVIPYKNHGIRCPKFDSDKNELAGHIPQTFEYKKSTKPRGPRKTAADYCKPTHTFTHPTDIKKAEMVAAMDDELGDEISCLECAWNGTYEDLIFIDADGTGGGGYDFVLACPICDSDEWLDDMMEAEGYDEPCFSCDGMGAEGDEDCSYCKGSGLMSDTLRAEMAIFNNEYFDADCGCFKKKSAESEDKFEAPYAGAGSLMGIKGDSALSSFTTSELTESSAIHGDFDQASLNYSGHQNLEVRAEGESSEAEVKHLREVLKKVKECATINVKHDDAMTEEWEYILEVIGRNNMDAEAEIKIYSFKELSEEAQTKAVADYIEGWEETHEMGDMEYLDALSVLKYDYPMDGLDHYKKDGTFVPPKEAYGAEAAEVRAVKHNYITPCVFCGTTDDSHDFLTVIDDDFVREDWKTLSKKNEASIPHSICADCADAYSAEHQTLSFMDWAKQEQASHMKKYGAEGKKNCGCGKDPCITYGAEGSGEITKKVVKDYHWETEPHPHEHDDLIYNGYVNEEMKGVMEDALEDGDNDSWVSHTHYTTDEDGKDVEIEVSGIFLAEDEGELHCQNCDIASKDYPQGLEEITIYNKWGDEGDYAFCGDGCEGQWMRENRMTYDKPEDMEAEDQVPRWAKPLGLIGGLAIGYISAQMIDNKKE